MNRDELLAAFSKNDSPEQDRFVIALMDITGCRSYLGLGWIRRLVAATEEEIQKAADIANGKKS